MLPTFIKGTSHTMAYQKENIQDPTGLGTIFEDVEFVVTTQHEGSEEQREVDHVSDEDFTDETEENATPLPLIVDSSPADVSEAESQPGSAFSSSSSDEDSDADDEGAEEEDEDDVADQAEEWVDPNDNSLSPPPPAEEVLVQPAVVGLRYFWGETYDLYKFDGKRYHSSSSDSEKYKRKKRRHRKATSTRAVRPSPLRTASNPDSPISPKDKSSASGFGVLPEPSPEAEGAHIVSPLSDDKADPELPELASEQQAPAAKRDWSEEDESDTSWVPDAIAEVMGSDRDSGDDLVSPLEEADVETPDFDDEDGKVVSLEAPTLDMDEYDEPEKAPEGFNPTFVGSSDEPETAPEGFKPTFVTLQPKKFHDPTSPDPDGPEILTGLDPRAGFDAWKEWHDRNDVDGQRFRTKYFMTDDNGKSGDLNVYDDSDRSDAADFLRKQRLLLKEKKAGASSLPSIVMVPGHEPAERKADRENIVEFMKIQMLKYRYQRNFFRYEFKICERNLRDSQDRVSRRDETIQDLDGTILRREEMIAKLKSDNAQMVSILEETEAAWDDERAKRELLSDEHKRLRMFSEQYKKAAQQNAEKLRRNRSERDADFQMSTIMSVISQSPVDSDPAASTADSEAVSTLKKQNEALIKDIAKIKEDDVQFIQKQSASILGMKAATDKILQKTFATHEGEKSALEDHLADSRQHAHRLQSQVDELLKQLDTATKGQAQAEAEAVNLKLQKKDELEDKLAASRSHTEALKSRKDELETKQANAKLTSDLSDCVKAAKAAEEVAQGQIEDLQAQLKAKSEKLATAEKKLTGANDEFGEIGADIAAWQKDYDGIVVELEVGKNALKDELEAERQQSKTLREETASLREALLAREHNNSPAVTHISSPLQPPSEQQQPRKAAFNRPAGWVSRENAILQQAKGANDLKSRRVAREKRQEVESDMLDQIWQRFDSVFSILGVSKLLYVPPQGRFLAMAV
jgi:chromosome segregation ATPase